MVRARAAGVAIAGMVLAAFAVPANGQTSLGDQRVGTSAASFLRIPVGARAAAMAGAFVAACDDVTACAWNPAGLIHIQGDEVAFNHTDWPADIAYNHLCYGRPIRSLDGVVAIQFGSLSTELMETTEYHPYGTGRSFSFTDWLVGLSLAKRFTDRFSGGVAVKYVREELGVEIGGPVTHGLTMDAGTYYQIGPGNMRLSVALMNFGPDMAPSGTYTRGADGTATEASYQGFSPATEFKFGIAVEPVVTDWLDTVFDIELMHPADNVETFRLGGEALILGTLALRGGFDTHADEMKTSAGVGAVLKVLETRSRFDYAATFTDHLGTVHRFSLTLGF
jgi:hypothetical protein